MAMNNERLAETYHFAINFLNENGVPYYKGANAGYFLWVDLKKISRKKPSSVEEATALLNALEVQKGEASDRNGEGSETTKEIMANLLEHKVFLASSTEFGGEEEGWFRIVFSQGRRYVEEGLRRMMKAVSSE